MFAHAADASLDYPQEASRGVRLALYGSMKLGLLVVSGKQCLQRFATSASGFVRRVSDGGSAGNVLN